MSKILRRPMFRGGGKVSSYGNGIATGLADGGMPDKRGLVDGPGGYAGIGTGGFYDSILGKGLRSVKDYAGKPFLNFINQDIANPLLSLAGYGDFFPRMETPLDDKYLLGLDENYKKIPADEREKFSDRYLNDGTGPIETDSGAIGKASAKARQQNILAQELDEIRIQRKKDQNQGAQPDRSSREKILEDKEIFEEILGGGKKAKIQDASNMALSFAGKALKEGATTKSAFADFFEEQSKAPSRSSKVSDAAAQAAINSYLAGEKTYNEMLKAIEVSKINTSNTLKLKADYAAGLPIVKRYGLSTEKTTKGKMQEAVGNWMYDNNFTPKSGIINYVDEEDVAVTGEGGTENVGEIFVDLESRKVFIIILDESGNPMKKVIQ
jgi:hypothetical protein